MRLKHRFLMPKLCCILLFLYYTQAAIANPSIIVPGLEEPLVSLSDTATPDDDLQEMINGYQRGEDPENLLTDYHQAQPNSPWQASIQLNLGLLYYQRGYFSQAIIAFEQAWQLSQAATGRHQKAMADRAFAELIRMHARLGHATELSALLDDIQHRRLTGQATEAVAGAREALWLMQNEPGFAFLCGPKALQSILQHTRPQSTGINTLLNVRSDPTGLNLHAVEQLSATVGLSYRAVYRTGTQPIPTPAVIHWKLNHYAAVIADKDGFYHIQDPTFGQDLWISHAALNAESSGYFLIPPDTNMTGWRDVPAAEAEQIYGKGVTQNNNPDRTRPDDNKSKDCGCDSDKQAMVT